MITVPEATEIILNHIIDTGVEKVSLQDSLGRVLAEPLIADRDFPPFDRVTMDGIAIAFEQYASGNRNFRVSSIAPAGAPQVTLTAPDECVEVMTGAILPAGTDTVIRYEDININDSVALININNVRHKQNVHKKAEDRNQGETVVPAGIRISAAEIGVASTVGKSEILVKALPRVTVVSTGDELVPVEQSPLPYQIRQSNVYQIRSVLSKYGITADLVHIRDDEEQVVSELNTIVASSDVIILSGGVSKGKFDYVPDALERLKVQKHFHRIAHCA